jgi:hypothetical protein
MGPAIFSGDSLETAGMLVALVISDAVQSSSPGFRMEEGSRTISFLREAPALGWSVEKGNTASSKTTSREI